MASTASESPFKRKRDAPTPDFSEGWDVDSLQVESIPSRKKKARFQVLSADDDASDHDAASSVPSLAVTNTTSLTAIDSESPLTNASSSQSKTKPRPKKYHCTFPDCHKAFDRPIRLQTHINSHTGIRPHQCPQDDCDKSFYKPEHLKRHINEKHGNSTFVCTFETRNEETGMIGPCGRVFESSNKLKRHIAVHEDKEETTCDWDGCGKVFRKQETLQRHIKKDHLKQDAYICKHSTNEGGTCGEAFPTPGQLKGHEARQHAAPKYVCEVCSQGVPLVDDMVAAELAELDPAFLPSPKEYSAEAAVEDVHSVALSGLSLEDADPEFMYHAGGVVAFPTYHDLQRHMKVCHPPTCAQCGKRCKSNRDLAAHVDIAHAPLDGVGPAERARTKNYVCPYEGCPRSEPSNGFSKKGNMDVHIKSAHTKSRDFVCGVFDLKGNEKVEGWDGRGCGFACASKQSLIGHVRTQHMRIPAALGVRTGLLEKSGKREHNKSGRRDRDDTEDGGVMTRESSTNAVRTSKALSMLTGADYEILRPHACLLSGSTDGCQMRFTNQYELAMHLELTHEWNVDDINDALDQGSQSAGGVGGTDALANQATRMVQAEAMEVEMVDPSLLYGR